MGLRPNPPRTSGSQFPSPRWAVQFFGFPFRFNLPSLHAITQLSLSARLFLRNPIHRNLWRTAMRIVRRDLVRNGPGSVKVLSSQCFFFVCFFFPWNLCNFYFRFRGCCCRWFRLIRKICGMLITWLFLETPSWRSLWGIIFSLCLFLGNFFHVNWLCRDLFWTWLNFRILGNVMPEIMGNITYWLQCCSKFYFIPLAI